MLVGVLQDHCANLFRCELAATIGHQVDLVPCRLDRAGFMDMDVRGIGGDHGLMRTQHRCQRDEIGLRSTRDEMHRGIRITGGLAHQGDGTGRQGILAVARLLSRGGNSVGALFYDTGVVRVVPPGTGRRHVLRIGAELARTAGARRGSTTDLAAMLDAAARLARRRSLIVAVSDFIGTGDWERSLLRLTPRHEVAALRVIDAADDELPDAGLIVVEDAETGEQLIVDSGDPVLRARFQAGAGERAARLDAGMRRAGVLLQTISTTDDLAASLIEVVTRTHRRRT